MNELVTVVVPSHRCGAFVCEAIDSALAQTYHNVEILVVDTGCDDTKERLVPYGDRIRYIHQPPRGLSAARNLAVTEAGGKWIALLDADDIWHPQKTEMQLQAARTVLGCALVSSAAAKNMPATLDPQPATRPLSVSDFLLSMPIGPSGTLLRRSALEEVGMFDESLPFVEDRDMWLRMTTRFPCLLVDSPCWWHRQREGQMSRDAQGNYESHKRVLNKFFREQPAYRGFERAAWSYFYADSAWTHFNEGDRKAALLFMARSFWLHPTRYRGGPPQRSWWRSKASIRYLLGTRLCRLLRPGIH